MAQGNSYMGQVLVVMEEGETHAHGALPRVSEVPPMGDGLYRHLC